MVNDALSTIVLIVAVKQLPINIEVDKWGTIKLLASLARNSASPPLLGCFCYSSTVLTPYSCCL